MLGAACSLVTRCHAVCCATRYVQAPRLCSPHCRAFGTVYEAEDLRTGEVFAVKQISKAKLACTEDVEDVRREMQVSVASGCRCGTPACALATPRALQVGNVLLPAL